MRGDLSQAGVAALAQLLTFSALAQSGASIAPGNKGGQDPFGPYEPVPGWPKDISTLEGNDGWTWGAVHCW